MYPINSPNNPAPSGGYVPYFYQAGLCLRYALPSFVLPNEQYESPHQSTSMYSASSLFQHADRIQTVDDVIARGYFAVPQGDPVTAIISDKEHTARLGLDDVVIQVRKRYEICQANMLRIEHAKCAAANAVYQHEAYVGPADSRQHYAKHKAIQDLYAEQSKELVELWRDVTRVRQLLPECAQLYLSAHRKASVLRGGAE